MGDAIDAPVSVMQYADMALREHFVDRLDPKAHKLTSILAEYWLPQEIECALTDCRTPHRHGLLVRTEDGTETNIGSDCGQKYFPDDYDALRRSFNVRRARAAHMDVISEYLERTAGYNGDIDTVWYEDRGGRWADECKDLYIKLCPASVRNHIMQMARSGSWVIKVQVRISEEEKDNDAGLGYRRDQEYIEKRVGLLRGGAALLKTVASVLRPLRETMTQYASAKPFAMTAPARRKWAEWSKSIPARLDEARTLVTQARELYVVENLEQLVAVARWKDEKRDVRTFLRAIQCTADFAETKVS